MPYAYYLYHTSGNVQVHILYDAKSKILLAMYRKAGALSVTVPFSNVKTHMYSVPLAAPLKFAALKITIKLFTFPISNP